ncbi:MAG: hypothetical protein MR937_07190 [Spirochaetia bacterium]|nr:hypothetical protein [Spirochaetia bacterium]
MKKLLVTLISLSVMAGSAFARGMYNGDVQLHLGTGMDSFTSESISDLNFDVKSNTFDFDVASWHLFSLNDLFSVGFMVDFNGGVGATKDITVNGFTGLKSSLALHFNGLIGPAVGFTFGNISALNISAGLAFGATAFEYKMADELKQYQGASTNYVSYSAGGVGFGAEINAKFFPKSKVSPLVGFKFSVLGTNEYEANIGGKTGKVEEKLTIYNTEYFAGIAFNF